MQRRWRNHSFSGIRALVLLSTMLSAALADPTADTERLRNTVQGKIVGKVASNGSLTWQGVPYAAAPVGERRWRAPRPPRAWQGIRHATQPRSPCLQLAGDGSLTGNEDCLYLNIWAPSTQNHAEGPLPVMVWIHGGANILGDGGHFGGSVLAQRERVIVVTLNYRLGPMGWLTHPALSYGQNTLDASGNDGLLDQIRALQWVRQNIAAFGGDPNRVTVFGESAGGQNIFALLVSPLAEGLFQRAIIQSGSVATHTKEWGSHYRDQTFPGSAMSSGELLLQFIIAQTPATNRSQARQLARQWKPDQVAAFMRSIPAGEVMHAYDRLFRAAKAKGEVAIPALFRDGLVLPESGILKALADGRFNRVPVLLGATRDEFRILLPMLYTPANSFMSIDEKGRIRVNNPEYYDRISRYLSDWLWVKAVHIPATLMSQWSDTPIYVYRFEWDQLMPAPWLDRHRLGATHGLDVPFVFGHLNLGPEYLQIPLIAPQSRASYRRLSQQMMQYWAKFARTGNPSNGRDVDLPVWWPWQGNDKHVLYFNNQPYPSLGVSPIAKAEWLQHLASEPPALRCEVFGLLERLQQALGPPPDAMYLADQCGRMTSNREDQ